MQLPGLRAARRCAVLTQADLATIAHLSEATVVAAEKGKRVRISTVHKLAWALDVHPHELTSPPQSGVGTENIDEEPRW